MSLTILKETDKYIEYQTPPGPYSTGLRREQKFLCIGGPYNGKTLTNTQITEQAAHYKPHHTQGGPPHNGYLRYNSASTSGRNAPPPCVYVWLELTDA